MTQDQRQFWISQFAIGDMQIRTADTAGGDADQQLVCLRFGNRQIGRLKGSMSKLENLGVHGNVTGSGPQRASQANAAFESGRWPARTA
jgi:hypothetical protein